jgi:hypothetical protein
MRLEDAPEHVIAFITEAEAQRMQCLDRARLARQRASEIRRAIGYSKLDSNPTGKQHFSIRCR